MSYVKGHHVNRVIPIKTMVRAYELYKTTDLRIKEIARALCVDDRKLRRAIAKAESDGLVKTIPYKGVNKKIIDALNGVANGLTSKEIGEKTGDGISIRRAISYAYNAGYLTRIIQKKNRKSVAVVYKYYLNKKLEISYEGN